MSDVPRDTLDRLLDIAAEIVARHRSTLLSCDDPPAADANGPSGADSSLASKEVRDGQRKT